MHKQTKAILTNKEQPKPLRTKALRAPRDKVNPEPTRHTLLRIQVLNRPGQAIPKAQKAKQVPLPHHVLRQHPRHQCALTAVPTRTFQLLTYAPSMFRINKMHMSKRGLPRVQRSPEERFHLQRLSKPKEHIRQS